MEVGGKCNKWYNYEINGKVGGSLLNANVMQLNISISVDQNRNGLRSQSSSSAYSVNFANLAAFTKKESWPWRKDKKH